MRAGGFWVPAEDGAQRYDHQPRLVDDAGEAGQTGGDEEGDGDELVVGDGVVCGRGDPSR